LLLVHIRAVFDGTDEADEDEVPEPVDEILSADLVRRLCAREDWPWAELGRDGLTAPELARRLRDFGMRPRQLKRGGRNRRGYQRAQFCEAWARFVPVDIPPDLPATSATALPGRSESAFRGSGQDEAAATPATSPEAATSLSRAVAEVAEVAGAGGDIAEDVARDDGACRIAEAIAKHDPSASDEKAPPPDDDDYWRAMEREPETTP
jgi:hypothetical protein